MRESNRSGVSALLGSSSASTTWCYSSVVTVSFSISFKPCLSPVYSPPLLPSYFFGSPCKRLTFIFSQRNLRQFSLDWWLWNLTVLLLCIKWNNVLKTYTKHFLRFYLVLMGNLQNIPYHSRVSLSWLVLSVLP